MSSQNIEIGPGVSLRGAHLEGRDLRGKNLEEANLQGAFLQGVRLERAHLRGAILSWADLRGANLEGANLEEVDLTGVDLTDAHFDEKELSKIQKKQIRESKRSRRILEGIQSRYVITNLEESNKQLKRVDLKNAYLNYANLKTAYLCRADLRGTHLRGAILERAELEGANLRGATLEGAYLKEADLEGAFLEEATLEGAHLEEAHLEGAYLQGATLEGAHLEGAHLQVAYLQGANIRGAHLEGADLKNAHLQGAHLQGAHLEGADLKNAHLQVAYLRRAHLEGAHLERAYLLGAYLEGAHLEGVHLIGAELTRAHLQGAHLEGADLRGRADLRGADLTRAQLQGAHLQGARLEEANLEGAELEGVDLTEVALSDEQIQQIIISDVEREQIAARVARQRQEIAARRQQRNRDRGGLFLFQQASVVSREIRISRELHHDLDSGSRKDSNSCANYKSLYDFIMKQDLNGSFRFVLEGIRVIDLAGITRQVYDKILPVYVNLYFIEVPAVEFILLKGDVDIDVLNQQTIQLIKLAKAAHAQIILRINPEVIGLLSEENPKERIESSKNFNSLYGNLKSRIEEVKKWEGNKFGYLLKNNANQQNVSLENINTLTREVKAEIILRKRLYDLGFTSWVQYNKMAIFIKHFWNTSNENKVSIGQVRLDLFANNIKYDIESFRKRIKIIGINDEVLDLSRIPQVVMQDYPGLKPLLDYILSESEEEDENRKIFTKFVSGTEYYPGELKIKLTTQTMSPEIYNNSPFFGHSCDNRVDMFRVPANFNGRITRNIINTQLRASASSFNGREF
jgi:uncharacterized protein YjbI with pentapeptide repeats